MPTTNAERRRKYNASAKGKLANKRYSRLAKTKEKLKAIMEGYRKTPEGLLKYKARYIVNNAVRYGRLIKLPCQICGDVKTEGHHNDYNKPLEVWWLCRKHHKELHRRTI